MVTYILRLIAILTAVYGVYIFIGKKFIISRIYESGLYDSAIILLISEYFSFSISVISYYTICFALLGIDYIMGKGIFFIYNWRLNDVVDFIEITLKKNNISFKKQKYNTSYKFILLEGDVFTLKNYFGSVKLNVKGMNAMLYFGIFSNRINIIKQNKPVNMDWNITRRRKPRTAHRPAHSLSVISQSNTIP